MYKFWLIRERKYFRIIKPKKPERNCGHDSGALRKWCCESWPGNYLLIVASVAL